MLKKVLGSMREVSAFTYATYCVPYIHNNWHFTSPSMEMLLCTMAFIDILSIFAMMDLFICTMSEED